MDRYSVERYYRDVDAMRERGVTVNKVGVTALGRTIHMLSRGDPMYGTILVQATTHAREYITTPLVMEMLGEYRGRARICVIPCVNVDGMALVLEGIDSVRDASLREWLIGVNGGSLDFSLWKANAKAVDINTNFDANWGHGVSNIRYPSYANYIGEYPISERESQVLAGVTSRISPYITLSYHTKGEVIYEGYEGICPEHDLARDIAKYTYYTLLESHGSYGGYKDWFVANTHRLGLTIECGDDDLAHPIGMDGLDDIMNTHRGLLDMLSEWLVERYRR